MIEPRSESVNPASFASNAGGRSAETPDFQVVFESLPGLYLLLLPNAPTFTILAASDAYLQATKKHRKLIVGRPLFEVFPDNPNDPTASGVTNLYQSLLQVLGKGSPHIMPVQKYDIQQPDSDDGGFEERYWAPVNSPVLNASGDLVYVLHRVEDVTELVLRKRTEAEQNRLTDFLRFRTDRMEAELSLRDQVLAEARHLIAERERAEAALAARVQLTALSASIGLTLTQLRDLPKALQRCAESIVTHLDAAFARIWTLNAATDVLELQASAGLYTHLNGSHSRIPVGSFKIGLIAKECKPHLTNRVSGDPRISDPEWARREGIIAFAGYPLVVDDRVTGVVALFSRSPLDEDTLAVLGSVADSIAVGIERKKFEDTLSAQAETLARSNASLQQQWNTFDTALSNSLDFTYIFDLNGRFTYVNQALLSLLQKPLSQTIGKNFFELDYPPELAARLQQQIQRVIETEKVLRDDTPFAGPSGEIRFYDYIFVPVLNDSGEVEAVAGSTRDITEQRAREEELRKANRELEEFAYVASHDLQEPLRMVNIYTQLILKQIEGGSETLRQYAAFVRHGAARMDELLRDLLTFSQAVHKEDSPLGTASLSDALDEATFMLRNRIEETGATISASSLPNVLGDTSQLTQVFQNLISNSLKYSRKNVLPEILISCKAEGKHCVIAFQDNGIGFEPQYAERIFGLFKRLHKEEYPGTGLGLAICQRIIERYGGVIWAEGKPGQGAVFYFSLPLAA